jgi:hypothetical protein
MINISQEYLKSVLDYNKDTGEFTWIISKSGVCGKNPVAGGLCHGYIRIRINGKKYFAHRLAWLYVYGSWPKNQLDHINGNRSDNRISNLRNVTNRENQQNQYKHRNGKIPNTQYIERLNKWASYVNIDRKKYYLGVYLTESQAKEAHLAMMWIIKELNHVKT